MKRKYYNEFLTLFDSISDARTLISGFSESDLVSKPDLVEIRNSRLKGIEKKYNKMMKLGYAPSDEVFDEITTNIIKCHSLDDKESFLVLILNKFRNIAPYLNFEYKKDHIITLGEQSEKIGENPYLEEYDCIHKLIGKHRKLSLENINTTLPEDYILRCHSLYIFFFIRLDALAFDFNLDLSYIQNKHNLNIFIRDEESLKHMGYLNELTLSNKHNIMQDEKILSFPEELNKPELPESLEMLFESISKYKTIMEILVSEKFLHPNTYIWKDEKKGYKELLVAIIKDLHGKGYFKDNIKPTNNQIEAICQKSFGLNVGIDTIKHTPKGKITDKIFEKIPLASTID